MTLLILLTMAGLVESEYLEQKCFYERAGSYITSVYAGDLNGDGVNEIFAGTDNGVIMSFSYGNCRVQWTPEWQYIQRSSEKGEIREMTISDQDADGKNELVAAVNSRDHYMLVLNNLGLFKWEDENSGGFALSVDVADIDNDSVNEIIFGTKGNRVVAVDGEDEVKWRVNLDNPVYSVKAVDLDDDGDTEIIAVTSEYGIANICALDKNGEVIWNHSIEDGIYQPSRESISIAELDNDNRPEISAATYKRGVVVLDHDGTLMWDYPTGNVVNSVHISDLNSDGENEIIFSSNPYLYILNQKGEVEVKANINGSARVISASDLEGDGIKEIIIGTNNLIKVVGADGIEKGKWSFGRNVNEIKIHTADLNKDNTLEIIAGLGWVESRLDQKHYSGELHVFGVKTPVEVVITTIRTVTTTFPETTSTISTRTTTTTTTPAITTTKPEDGGKDTGGIILSMISAFLIGFMLLILFAIILLGVYLIKKGRDNPPDKEEQVVEVLIEERKEPKEGKEKEGGHH